MKCVDITIFVAPYPSKLQVAPAATTPLYTWGVEVQRKCSQNATMTKQQSVDSRCRVLFFFFFQIYVIANITSLNYLMKTLCQSTFLQTDSYGNFKYGNLSIYLSTYLFIKQQIFNISFKNISFSFQNAHTLVSINSFSSEWDFYDWILNT